MKLTCSETTDNIKIIEKKSVGVHNCVFALYLFSIYYIYYINCKMATFDLNSLNTVLDEPAQPETGVDFSGKSLKLDTAKDAQQIVDAINKCPNLQYLALTGNTLGVTAAHAISKALESHPELKIARFSDMFTGRMKTEIPPALSALGDGMIAAGARLAVLDLSDNAFGPIGVEGLAKLLQSDVCSDLEELRLNNNGLGITGGKLLARALSSRKRRLRVFIAGRNRLENDGATALAKVFQEMGSLEEIAMPQNGIYHVGITALSEAFKHNPALNHLNLNDNTIGAKGAEAIAGALPRLKNLKSINFGDCLLKSRGARALAKAFKGNSLLLESLDLSHNEIGREACMELVDAITEQPDSQERLSRIVLAGNSLGNAANKKSLKDKLGASAELSDGEGSDDEYVTEPEEEDDTDESEDEDEDSEEAGSADSSPEDIRDIDTVIDVKEISLDDSGREDIQSDVERFLKDPSVKHLNSLGDRAAELIDAHLQMIRDPDAMTEAYAQAVLCASGLSSRSAAATALAMQLYPLFIARAKRQMALANSLLPGLGLIKWENKDYKIRWDLPGCYSILANVLDEAYFPAGLRDTLRFFITSKLPTLPTEIELAIKKHPTLYTNK
ncbi:ran GTPase-activating protein 1 isoform X2 [Bombyx mori]